jgi:hypothetical protein
MITPEALALKMGELMTQERADAITMIRAMSIVSDQFKIAIEQHHAEKLVAADEKAAKHAE